MTRTIRAAILIGVDLLSWIVAAVAAAMLRYDFVVSGLDPVPVRLSVALGLAMGVIQVIAGLLLNNYSGRNRLGGYADFVNVTLSSLVPSTLASLWLVSTTPRPLAVSVPLIALPTALVSMLVARGLLAGYPRLAGQARSERRGSRARGRIRGRRRRRTTHPIAEPIPSLLVPASRDPGRRPRQGATPDRRRARAWHPAGRGVRR